MNADASRDLGYVREVVARSERPPIAPSILYLWAAISLAGFAVIDFAPRSAGLYWLVAGIAGFVLSSWLGARHARATGQESRGAGTRQMLHWAGMGVAIFLLSFGSRGWGSSPQESSHAILLIVALSYWLAGVHMVAPMKWLGVVAAALYAALAVVEGFAYPWTAAGIVIAAGLVIAARGRGAARAEG